MFGISKATAVRKIKNVIKKENGFACLLLVSEETGLDLPMVDAVVAELIEDGKVVYRNGGLVCLEQSKIKIERGEFDALFYPAHLPANADYWRAA